MTLGHRPGRGWGGPYAGPVLTISQELHDAIVEHARRDHPVEACGVIAGPEGSDRPERLVEMVHAAGSPTFYEYDSTELLRLYPRTEGVRMAAAAGLRLPALPPGGGGVSIREKHPGKGVTILLRFVKAAA